MVEVVDAEGWVVGFAADVALLNEVVVADVHHGVPEHKHRRHEGLCCSLQHDLEQQAQGNKRERPTVAGHWLGVPKRVALLALDQTPPLNQYDAPGLRKEVLMYEYM